MLLHWDVILQHSVKSFIVKEMRRMCIVKGTFYTTCVSLLYAYQGSDSRKGNEPDGLSIQAAPEDPQAENSTWIYSLRCGHTLCPWWSDRQQQWISLLCLYSPRCTLFPLSVPSFPCLLNAFPNYVESYISKFSQQRAMPAHAIYAKPTLCLAINLKAQH